VLEEDSFFYMCPHSEANSFFKLGPAFISEGMSQLMELFNIGLSYEDRARGKSKLQIKTGCNENQNIEIK